jgi:hypothetical protein
MRRLIAAGALVVATAGCSEKPASTGEVEAVASGAPAPTLSAGMEVVAAMSDVAFRQGTVVSLDTEKVTFEYGTVDPATGKKPTASADLGRAWRIGTPPNAAKDDYLVCMLQRRKSEREPPPTWYPCKVLGVSGNKLHVSDYLGLEYELDPEHALRPDELTRKAIAGYLDTEQKHRTFDRGFEEAGRPVRPAGWEPKAGEPIVIHWVGTSWYGGKVVELKRDKNKVRVDFEGNRWDDRDVPLSEVSPQPAGALEVAAEQFAILRPKEADQRWDHVRVKSVAGEDVEVLDRDGGSRKVARKDLIPIAAVAPPPDQN